MSWAALRFLQIAIAYHYKPFAQFMLGYISVSLEAIKENIWSIPNAYWVECIILPIDDPAVMCASNHLQVFYFHLVEISRIYTIDVSLPPYLELFMASMQLSLPMVLQEGTYASFRFSYCKQLHSGWTYLFQPFLLAAQISFVSCCVGYLSKNLTERAR